MDEVWGNMQGCVCVCVCVWEREREVTVPGHQILTEIRTTDSDHYHFILSEGKYENGWEAD